MQIPTKIFHCFSRSILWPLINKSKTNTTANTKQCKSQKYSTITVNIMSTTKAIKGDRKRERERVRKKNRDRTQSKNKTQHLKIPKSSKPKS